MKTLGGILLVTALAWAAGAAWAAETAKGPRTVAQRLEMATQMIDRADRRDEAVRLCDEIIAGPAEMKDKIEALRIQVEMSRKQNKWDDALKAADRFLQAMSQDKAAEQAALLMQADILRQAKKEPEALAKVREFLQRQPDNKPGGAEARIKAAELLLNTNKQNAEARDEAAKAMELDPQNDVRVGEALWVVQEASWRMEEIDKAVAALARLLEAKYHVKRDPYQVRDAKFRYGQGLRRLKKFDEARAHYAALEKAETDPRQAAEWCLQTADTFTDESRDDDALPAYERVFTAHPDVPDLWYGAQRRIVDILYRKGRMDEAIKAARVCLDAARDDGAIGDSVRIIAEAMKGIDKNFGRANAFINFQRYGPAGEDGKVGTDDDIKNPLEEFPRPSYPEREKAFEAARKKAGDDSKAMRFRAQTYLYSGKPKEALRCFMDAFGRCTPDELQQAGPDMILTGARAVRGYCTGLEVFFQFVNYGPAGPDGKTGTADDLADPFAPLLK